MENLSHWHNKLLIFTLTSILVLSVFSIVSDGAVKKKWVEAYSDIRVEYNGTPLTGSDAPLLIQNKAYVPLRTLMSYFGDKEIQWDAGNRNIRIISKQNPMEAMYMSQISLRNSQITDLEDQVKDLKAQLKTAKAATMSTKTMRKVLNAAFGKYDGKTVSFSVSGNATNLTLSVVMSASDWNSFSSYDKARFLNTVCATIYADGSQATITGTVKDGSSTLKTFTVKPGQSVTL